MKIEIIQAETPAQIAQARSLFREYEAWLGLNLCFQNFEEEVANLPGKYAESAGGRLFLAFVDDERLAGCIALRKLEDGVCEMKRLFVRADFRGRKIGKVLIEKLIEEARAVGYRKMRLDTYPPKMAKAFELYQSHGFREIPPYYHNPLGETLYMEKMLDVRCQLLKPASDI
ncbi:MAG TPA: GNAT family N-acetyltransferase [Pyrinomonadaceae bacterium]|nr:GNAT family N-acetyltransferase [Pyrinomonadaceae bacterium]